MYTSFLFLLCSVVVDRRRLFDRRNLGEQSRRNGCAGNCEKRLG
jgi:hypothetical protein